jgi:predicted RNA-binding protein with PIN domain
MSLHFLIDGYNAIKQVKSLNRIRSLNEARVALIKSIQAKRLLKSKNNQITVVFDGKEECGFSFFTSKDYPSKADFPFKGKTPLNIIFSKGESADEVIKRMVQDSSRPRQIIVVSDDKGIVYLTNSLGAKAMSPTEFLHEKQKPRPKSRGQKNNTQKDALSP